MKWLADENFRSAILRAIYRRNPTFDVLRVQDIPAITGADDLTVLRFARHAGRSFLTHDLSTMIPAIRELSDPPQDYPPIVLVPDDLPIHTAMEDILLLDECGSQEDWPAGVLYLPLR